jgi:hypothetical protein
MTLLARSHIALQPSHHRKGMNRHPKHQTRRAMGHRKRAFGGGSGAGNWRLICLPQVHRTLGRDMWNLEKPSGVYGVDIWFNDHDTGGCEHYLGRCWLMLIIPFLTLVYAFGRTVVVNKTTSVMSAKTCINIASCSNIKQTVSK